MSESRWTQVGTYAAQIEADFHRATLEEAGIPVLVKGPLTGAFGPGFAGATMHGVAIYVPGEFLDQARAMLAGDDDIEPNGAA